MTEALAHEIAGAMIDVALACGALVLGILLRALRRYQKEVLRHDQDKGTDRNADED